MRRLAVLAAAVASCGAARHRRCGHQHVSKSRAAPVVVPAPRHASPAGGSTRPLRIRYVFTSGRQSSGACTSGTRRAACSCSRPGQEVISFDLGGVVPCEPWDVLGARQEHVIRSALDAAAARLGSVLHVRPADPVPLGGEVCSVGGGGGMGVVIPPVHSSDGVDGVDFLAYVTATPPEDPDAYVAWAASCRTLEGGRPVSGIINFNPSMLLDGSISIDEAMETATHELLHALGFGWETFAGQIRKDGEWVSMTQTHNSDGRTVTTVVSPRVQEKAREHFGCPDLAGVALEDQGEEGTAGSHWDKQVMGTELMTGILSPGQHEWLSPITLAAMEDTGWYAANYKAAEEFAWGRGKGCEFARGSRCDSLPSAGLEFCFPDDPLKELSADQPPSRCSPDRLTVSACGVVAYPSALPRGMRYFKDGRIGGILEYAAYCPSPMGLYTCKEPLWDCGGKSRAECTADQRCEWKASRCSARSTIDGSSYSERSRCFTQEETAGLPPHHRSFGARCLEVDCGGAGYRVKVGSHWGRCSAAGGAQVEWEGAHSHWSAALTCPRKSELCDVSPPQPAAAVAAASTSAELERPPPRPREQGEPLGDCPWTRSSGKRGVLQCADRTECYVADLGWDCCAAAGGRARCPTELPVMCSRGGVQRCGGDHCCVRKPSDCDLSALLGSVPRIVSVKHDVSFVDAEGDRDTLRMQDGDLTWEVRSRPDWSARTVHVGPVEWDSVFCTVMLDSMMAATAVDGCDRLTEAIVLEQVNDGPRQCPSGGASAADAAGSAETSDAAGSGRRTLSGCACAMEWSCVGCMAWPWVEGSALTPCTSGCCNPDDDPAGPWCLVQDPACEGAEIGYCEQAVAAHLRGGGNHTKVNISRTSDTGNNTADGGNTTADAEPKWRPPPASGFAATKYTAQGSAWVLPSRSARLFVGLVVAATVVMTALMYVSCCRRTSVQWQAQCEHAIPGMPAPQWAGQKGVWVCALCTLVNEAADEKCGGCGAPQLSSV